MRTITCLAAAVLVTSLACSTTSTPKPQPGSSYVVMDALKASEATSEARVNAHVRASDAVKARYEQPLAALAKRAEAAGADVAGATAASRAFAESKNAAGAEAFNAKYATPMRRAIDDATNIPGLGTLLAGSQTTPQYDPGELPVPLHGHAPSCCRTFTLQPPWEGLFSEADFGARAIRPGPVTVLNPSFSGAVLYAPHRLQRSGRSFTVNPGETTITVDTVVDTSWNLGVTAVFGFAHAWLGLSTDVTAPGGRVVCSTPRIEQANRQIVLGSDGSRQEPGPRLVRTCVFTRSATDPTTFSTNVTATANGTFVGSGGGFADYRVTLGTVTITACP